MVGMESTRRTSFTAHRRVGVTGVAVVGIYG